MFFYWSIIEREDKNMHARRIENCRNAKRSLFRCVESSTCAVLHLCGDEISALAFDTGHDHA